MMYYIQTQEAPLPYVYRTFKTAAGAHRAATRFMNENTEAGAIAVMTALHDTKSYMFRDQAGQGYTEEFMSDETGEVALTIHH